MIGGVTGAAHRFARCALHRVRDTPGLTEPLPHP
jgi:hypothetical protein